MHVSETSKKNKNNNNINRALFRKKKYIVDVKEQSAKCGEERGESHFFSLGVCTYFSLHIQKISQVVGKV